MGFFEKLLGSGRVEGGLRESIEERVEPPLSQKIANLSAQGRARVASAVKRASQSHAFPNKKPNASAVGMYVDGLLRGGDHTRLVKKSRLDFETADAINKLVEREINKLLY